MRELPSESRTTQFRVYENGAVAVVPHQAKQAGLSGSIGIEIARQFGQRDPGAPRNGVENVTRRRKPRFDSRVLGVHRAGHHAAYAGHETGVIRNPDDACRSTNDVDQIVEPSTRADGVPMRVERADWNRDPCFDSQFFCPFGTELSGNVVRGLEPALQLVRDASKEWIHFRKELAIRESSQRAVP